MAIEAFVDSRSVRASSSKVERETTKLTAIILSFSGVCSTLGRSTTPWVAVSAECFRSVPPCFSTLSGESSELTLGCRPILLSLIQEYTVLLTQIETLFLTSPTFTLQKAFFHLHPTIHSLSLLHSLTNLLFHADDEEESDSESEESSIDSEAERLGLGGKRTKVDGLENERLVLGGEVLQLIWQMGRNRSGSVLEPSLSAFGFTLAD